VNVSGKRQTNLMISGCAVDPLRMRRVWLLCPIIVALCGLVVGGCATQSQSNRHGTGVNSYLGSDPVPIVPATEPTPLQEPASEVSDYEPTADDDVRVARLVNEAEDHLLDDQADRAVECLLEAQAIPGWAQSRHAPSLLFWLGHGYDRLNEPVAAVTAYRQLIARYPNTGTARRAQQRLERLEREVR